MVFALGQAPGVSTVATVKEGLTSQLSLNVGVCKAGTLSQFTVISAGKLTKTGAWPSGNT